jgi:hypothetical protein
LLFDVFALKNASQLAVIAATDPAGALAPVLALDGALTDAAGDVAADDVPAGGDEPAELGLLLPQAPRVTVSAVSAHAPTSWDMCPCEFITAILQLFFSRRHSSLDLIFSHLSAGELVAR